ncbi:oxalate decarboxylase [Rhodocollybia butyracea]|uniref:Oxalate decarboxylase n=1 Tax=Rhodocollybia butyracea TaxID=206335 RepID=A0A9P5UB00_9AGAR|nr:oxalate decarboxylase [Rhodocollybia butyracea]
MAKLTFLIVLIALRLATSAPAPSNINVTESASAAHSSSSATLPVTTAAPSNSSVTKATSAAPSSAGSAALSVTTAGFASTNPNDILWNLTSPDSAPSPMRGSLGAPLLGPENIPLELENPDMFAPPTTDNGATGNSKWSFSLSPNRLQTGGWARQQNVASLPIATAMAGVNMRLEAGAIRELHWHSTAEWAYVLKGTTQITTVDGEGRNFIGSVKAGDIWYMPPGIPHSLQATGDDPDGSEFLLVFDDGAFSEDSTFLLTDWLDHVPAEVIAKNFQVDPSAFAHIPGKELYIFPSLVPSDDQQVPVSPQGTAPQSYTFPLSTYNATQLSGGSVKVVDSTIFPIATTIAVAEVTVEPGAMRELHWHPTMAMDEWDYFLEGTARVTVFASSSNARTFNYQAGDIGYIPTAMGHYVENTGNTTLRYLEIFSTDKFQDISLNQWLALTPPSLVKAHLNLDDETISKLSKTKPVVIG